MKDQDFGRQTGSFAPEHPQNVRRNRIDVHPAEGEGGVSVRRMCEGGVRADVLFVY